LIHPRIGIVTTASPTSGPIGSAVVFTFVVTNTGDTTLHDVSVADDVHGHVGDVASLEPGETARRTLAITLGSSPATNTGTATGTDFLGRSVTASDDATVTVVSAGGTGRSGGSPFTGSETGDLSVTTALLALAGAVLLFVTRRRGGSPI
jgi:hypothetical protein